MMSGVGGPLTTTCLGCGVEGQGFVFLESSGRLVGMAWAFGSWRGREREFVSDDQWDSRAFRMGECERACGRSRQGGGEADLFASARRGHGRSRFWSPALWPRGRDRGRACVQYPPVSEVWNLVSALGAHAGQQGDGPRPPRQLIVIAEHGVVDAVLEAEVVGEGRLHAVVHRRRRARTYGDAGGKGRP